MSASVDDTSILDELFGVAGKAVLVTGGTRGIGLAIARAFVRAGARVLVCSRNPDTCQAAEEELRPLGHAVAFPANLSSSDGWATVAERVRQDFGHLDVLVNNAGAIWAETLADYPEDGWDKVYDLNVKGTFFLVQALVPLLEAKASPSDPARIINVGSVDALHVPVHETYAYSSSKAAVHHLSRHLAAQLASSSILVNVIAPGLFPSKMLQGTLEARGEETVVAPVPLRRLTSDADMAAAALYLASPGSSYITGAVLTVDGGLSTTL